MHDKNKGDVSAGQLLTNMQVVQLHVRSLQILLTVSYVAVTKITIYKVTLINSSLFLNSHNIKWKQRRDTKYKF